MMNNITTIIFDLDGTMVDCKELHQDGFRWAVEQLVPSIQYDDAEVEGLPTTKKILYLRNKGYAVPDNVDILKREHTRAHIAEYVKYNNELYEQIQRLYTKYKMAIASNSRSEFVFKCMNILQLWQFECVLTRDYGTPKPDPWMYNTCMSICKSTPSNTLIFEDSELGIKGARASGANVIAVRDSNNLVERLKEL